MKPFYSSPADGLHDGPNTALQVERGIFDHQLLDHSVTMTVQSQSSHFQHILIPSTHLMARNLAKMLEIYGARNALSESFRTDAVNVEEALLWREDNRNGQHREVVKGERVPCSPYISQYGLKSM